ncbi:hypothetical protein [Microvirga vignae]|uniref:hypothetical protein n=1 Tax=Microvirga vignae TaxID=1225564 RepID=UPI000A78996E|nr:hypothetical protein [Microvirga vignae]
MIASCLKLSARGELKIMDVNRTYLKTGRGFVWLDTGTPDALIEAADFVHARAAPGLSHCLPSGNRLQCRLDQP